MNTLIVGQPSNIKSFNRWQFLQTPCWFCSWEMNTSAFLTLFPYGVSYFASKSSNQQWSTSSTRNIYSDSIFYYRSPKTFFVSVCSLTVWWNNIGHTGCNASNAFSFRKSFWCGFTFLKKIFLKLFSYVRSRKRPHFPRLCVAVAGATMGLRYWWGRGPPHCTSIASATFARNVPLCQQHLWAKTLGETSLDQPALQTKPSVYPPLQGSGSTNQS